jgi:hypothetical protein
VVGIRPVMHATTGMPTGSPHGVQPSVATTISCGLGLDCDASAISGAREGFGLARVRKTFLGSHRGTEPRRVGKKRGMGGMGERREMPVKGARPEKGARHLWHAFARLFLALTEAQSHGE